MRSLEDEADSRTIYCGNLSEDVTNAILFELFNQAGPVEIVRRPVDQNGRPKSFGFVVYKHECSVPYALELFRGTKLFNKTLNMNSRSRFFHIPVLDTHISEFTEQRNLHQSVPQSLQETHVDHWKKEYNTFSERERGHRNEDRHRNESSHSRHQRSKKKMDSNEPSSWAEFNALRGKGSLSNGHYREDLQGPPLLLKTTSNIGTQLPVLPDFNALLQGGLQMTMFSGVGNVGMMPMGLGPSIGGNSMYPSMQGRLSGGERNSPDMDRGRSHRENRESRRDHPYSDRWHNERRDEHRRHDRGYSSSHSSHDRERRDRKSH